ncbi:protein FAM32A-like [Halichondria panicea]|uniref:protein FAM32A-like n=1 Tax=Halichondria panicea TaxID=6063 RepID=UPI00312B733A
MSDSYDECVRGSLKLKGSATLGPKLGGKIKKKKKKNKAKEFIEKLEGLEERSSGDAGRSGGSTEANGGDERTKAELAFEKVQEKRKAERILKKARKTHKQRVEEFNSHLDTLTEHFDIPKVSWTK